jgi:DNA invertase Pin-like site-specific DNA recombinase
MTTSTRRIGGRTLVDLDPDQLVWILLARESTDRERQVNNQLVDLRAMVARIGGSVAREVPENDVSAFKRKRVMLPDGTHGYRVVRKDWEEILTALRRGEANALAVSDIDRATRDPRLLEDLIDVVELYGVYVADPVGNIDLTTDSGIDRARGQVNQRNQESRNTSRRVKKGKRHAAMEGRNHGGRLRPFGWRKDRKRLNKREAAHLRRELPRIFAGVSPITLAREWEARGIPTVTGAKWRAATIRNMYLRPRMCGKVVYQDEILMKEDGTPARGQWDAILSDEEYDAVVAMWGYSEHPTASRLGARGRGYRTNHLLSPFLRCGKCGARMLGSQRRNSRGELEDFYRCPGSGQGGCGGVSRIAEPVELYIKTLVIKEQQKVQFRQLENLPPWPKAGELTDLQGRMDRQQREYEKGRISAKRHFASLARMEADEAELLRESRAYERRRLTHTHAIANLADEWDKPDFTMEQKQAAVGESLEAVIIMPAGKGARFDPSQIRPIFKDQDISAT